MQFVKSFDLGMISFSYRMALTWKKKKNPTILLLWSATAVEGRIHGQATCSAAQPPVVLVPKITRVLQEAIQLGFEDHEAQRIVLRS